jgi:hypothetical protein
MKMKLTKIPMAGRCGRGTGSSRQGNTAGEEDCRPRPAGRPCHPSPSCQNGLMASYRGLAAFGLSDARTGRLPWHHKGKLFAHLHADKGFSRQP